jgi:hypothetical protein
MKNEFSDRFSKNTQILNFMKIRPVGAEFFPEKEGTDGRTDRQKTGKPNSSRFSLLRETRLMNVL